MPAQADTNTSVTPTTSLENLTFAGSQSELSVFDELFSSGAGAVANIGSVSAASGSSDGVSVVGNITDTALSQENCTNVMCIPDADYLEEIWDYIFPSPVEWIFISLHVVVFFMGLIGNSLVVYAVLRGKNMRSVTNTFIVNLAVADFLLLLICQPSSLLVDATETWYLGNALCKFITYFQTVTVYVSVFTLSAISIDRYYAICHPLKFIHTIRRAVAVTGLIWLISAIIASPELFSMELKATVPEHITNLLLTCSMSWDSNNRAVYQILQMVCIYFIPMSLMTCAYSIIAVRLWHTDLPGRDDPVVRMLRSGVSASHPETQLLSRRRVAKMLIAMVIIFAVCYLPVYVLNIMRQCGTLKTINGEWIPVFAMAARWLCYFNSAINPVIYNFMSAKFRKEFRFILTRCCRKNTGRRSYVQSFSRHSYKLPSTLRRTDHLTLSSLSTRQLQPSSGRTPMHVHSKAVAAHT